MKFGSLNLLEPSGPIQACDGIALPVWILIKIKENETLCYALPPHLENGFFQYFYFLYYFFKFILAY